MNIYLSTLDDNNQVSEITELEYDKILKLKNGYFDLLRLEEIYSNLIKNYRDFEIGMFEMSLDNIIYRDYSWGTFKDRIHENDRLIINLLAHTRMFLDRGDSIIKNVYGENSKESKYFRELKVSKYDSNFSYRLMEALRNYVLHKDLPVGKLDYGFKNVSIDKKIVKVSDCSPKLNIKLLIEDKNFKARIREELLGYDEINLRYHIRSFISDLTSIHQMFNGFQKEKVTVLIEQLRDVKKHFNDEVNYGIQAIDNTRGISFSFTFDMFNRMNELVDMNSTYHRIHEMLIML